MAKRSDVKATALWVLVSAGALFAAAVATALGPGQSAPTLHIVSDAGPAPIATHREAHPLATMHAAAALAQPGDAAQPGWLAVISARGVKEPVKTHAPAAEFALPKDATLYPGIPAAGLSVSYSATLHPEKGGKYRLWILSKGGKARLTAFGTTKGGNRVAQAESIGTLAPSQWFTSDGNPLTLSIAYERAGSAEARLQTYWERQGKSYEGGFVREPMPAGAVTVPAYAAKDTAAATSAFHGRVLLGELKCTACHSPDDRAMPALRPARAPLLGEVGRRLSPGWIQKWILAPQAMKPGSAMPDLLGDSPKDLADAEALTHFLVSMGGPVDWESAATEPQVLKQGRELYHSVGCIACHGALEPAESIFGDATMNGGMPSTKPPSPFGTIVGKWRPRALAEFLKDPLATHPSGRMPSMNLTDQESDLIATYLVSAWGQSPGAGQSGITVDPAKVEIGRAAFSARGCANCHEIGHNLPNIPGALKAAKLADLMPGQGCLSPTDERSPRFGLSGGDRADIEAALGAVRQIVAAGGTARAPIDEGRRTMEALGCIHCHERDGAGGVPGDLMLYFRTTDETELGDEGRLPPRLDGVGFKLHASWMREVLCEAGRARPYMATRMPQFGEKRVGELGDMLAMMDGVPPGADAREPVSTDELVLAGRAMVGEKGLNCISCHTFQGKTTGTPGPEITEFAGRLRYEWWKAYIMEPTRFKPGTRMTAFYREGPRPDQGFGGDIDRQTDAMWAYFNTGMLGPAPEGLSSAGMAVPVGSKPVVFRTFLKDAGSRGIAVGYPIGTHFGFDAQAVRLVSAWRGDFVDASGAWKGRGGTVAGGQGDSIWRAPAGPPIVIAGAPPAAWPGDTGESAGYSFNGYRYEKDGTPVFMYTIGGARIEERFEPAHAGLFQRTFTVTNLPEAGDVWVNTGVAATSTPVANATQVQTQGQIRGFKAQDRARPMTFSITIKPEANP